MKLIGPSGREVLHWRLLDPLMHLYNIGTVFAILMADPGFPGGHQSKRHRRQTIIWPIFTDNCMKIKKYWTVETGCPKFYYVDPPLNLNNSNKNFIPLFAFYRRKNLLVLRPLVVFGLVSTQKRSTSRQDESSL